MPPASTQRSVPVGVPRVQSEDQHHVTGLACIESLVEMPSSDCSAFDLKLDMDPPARAAAISSSLAEVLEVLQILQNHPGSGVDCGEARCVGRGPDAAGAGRSTFPMPARMSSNQRPRAASSSDAGALSISR